MAAVFVEPDLTGVAEFFGRHDVGHRFVVADAFLGVYVAGRDIADGVTGLADEYAAGGERLAVAHALDVVFDGDVVAAGAQEVSVERVQRGVGRGASGGERGLAEHEAAEQAALLAVGLANEPVVADALDIERADEAGDDILYGRVLLVGRGQGALLASNPARNLCKSCNGSFVFSARPPRSLFCSFPFAAARGDGPPRHAPIRSLGAWYRLTRKAPSDGCQFREVSRASPRAPLSMGESWTSDAPTR